MSSTRREALGAAVAGATGLLAAPAVAPAAAPTAPATIVAARSVTVRRGVAIAASRDGRTLVVAHDRRRTIALVGRGGRADRLVDVGGQPVEVAVSPDGRRIAVSTAAWDQPGLVMVDPVAARTLRRTDVGPAPGAATFTTGRRARLVVVGGEQEGTLHVLDADGTAVLARHELGLVPRGLAVTADGRAAWVALAAQDEVVRIDLRSGRLTRRLATPPRPERLALAPDGRRLLLTHAGPDADRVSEIDLRRGTVRRLAAGPLPAAVGYTRRGRRLAVVGGAGQVVVLGPRPRRRAVGGAPRGLAVVGERAFTVDHLTGAVHRVTA
ncbi:hypothetical protein GKE82_10235 [Conexibacter sp. W3-3-2]|uniref:YncE family protein n=1 Tax=Conexibacter sp. W3-3-2 TaxID=2675227 RepID=UPI0012B895F5|nr:hypothetical protein [Conexibacter sp. W3-3-2]MTD44656.1 hypothetical protein [Conexibacter sp. W3-3-2]